MKSGSWLTPPEWIEALGPFDLDPACPPNMPWATAARMLTKVDDGLTAPWDGRVWLNPPFGKEAALWLHRMNMHGNGIALIPARTETAMFYTSVWCEADAICFVRGRPHFHVIEDSTFNHGGTMYHVKRGEPAPFNSGAPICLVAYGQENVRRLEDSNLGYCVPDNHRKRTEAA